MSPKQLVYQKLIGQTLIFLRSRANQPWWQRLRDRTTYFETDLIHNLHISMFNPDITDHDIWFLNHQAHLYCQTCNEQLSPLYPYQVELIQQLFSLVSDEQRKLLTWAGPRA